jgi:hypothetical protein
MINSQKSHIGGRITPDQFGSGYVPTRQHNLDVALVIKHFIGRDDQSGSPEESTAARARGVNGDNTLCRSNHDIGERIG